jgi:hypothetical protein
MGAPSGRCRRTGKLSYDSPQAAEGHYRALHKRNHYVGEVYRCQFCHKWHIGRRPQFGRKGSKHKKVQSNER